MDGKDIDSLGQDPLAILDTIDAAPATDTTQGVDSGTEDTTIETTAEVSSEKKEPTVIEFKEVKPGSKPAETTEETTDKKVVEKPEPKVDEKKVDDKAAAESAKALEEASKTKSSDAPVKTKDEEAHEAALKKEVPGGANAKAKTREDWEAMRKAGDFYRSETESLKTKLATVEAEKAELAKKATVEEGSLPEPVKKELETLRAKVAEVDISALPEFQSKYDVPLTTIKSGVIGFFEELAKAGTRTYDLTDTNGNPTGQKGGLTADVIAGLKSAVEKHGFTNYNWAGWVNQCKGYGVINEIEAQQLITSLANAKTIESAKQAELKNALEVNKATRAQREASQKQDEDAWKAKVTEVGSALTKEIEESVKNNEWARKPAEPAANATAEEKSAYKEACERLEVKKTGFTKALRAFYHSQGIRFQGDETIKDFTPKEFVKFTEDAMRSHELDREVSTLKKQLEERDKELNEFRAGSSTAPRSGKGGSSERGAAPVAAMPLTGEGVLATIG